MLVLFATAFLLFGAPAILLYAGRLIQSQTDAIRLGATRPKPVLTGTEWYCRPPQPLFGQGAAGVSGAEDAAPAPQASIRDEQWFNRPSKPLFAWPGIRQIFRRPRNATSV